MSVNPDCRTDSQKACLLATAMGVFNGNCP